MNIKVKMVATFLLPCLRIVLDNHECFSQVFFKSKLSFLKICFTVFILLTVFFNKRRLLS